jgi:hypothetical protein
MVDRDQGGMEEDNRDHNRKFVHESRNAHSYVGSRGAEGMDLRHDDKNTWYEKVSIQGDTS